MTQTAPGSLVIRTAYEPEKEGVLGILIPQSTSFATWQAIGARLMKQGRSWPWKVGDWVFFGEGAYGERYKEAMETTGLEYQTLANYAHVAGRFEFSRRRYELTFAHHAEVASLGSDEEQDAWLDTAIAERWNVKDLRAAVRQHALSQADATVATQDPDIGAGSASVSERALEEGDREVGPNAPVAGLTPTRDDVASPSSSAPTVLLIVKPHWEEAAHAQGLALSDWLTAVADEVCRVAA